MMIEASVGTFLLYSSHQTFSIEGTFTELIPSHRVVFRNLLTVGANFQQFAKSLLFFNPVGANPMH